MTNCKAIDIQSLFDGRKTVQEASKAGFYGAQSHHGAKAQKIIQGRLMPCKTKYGKWKYTNCSKFVCSYCMCTPGLMFCVDCFANHRVEVATAQYVDTQFGVSSFS